MFDDVPRYQNPMAKPPIAATIYQLFVDIILRLSCPPLGIGIPTAICPGQSPDTYKKCDDDVIFCAHLVLRGGYNCCAPDCDVMTDQSADYRTDTKPQPFVIH